MSRFRRHPGLRLCIDHLGLPLIDAPMDEASVHRFLGLARYSGLLAKLSTLPARSRFGYPFPEMHDLARRAVGQRSHADAGPRAGLLRGRGEVCCRGPRFSVRRGEAVDPGGEREALPRARRGRSGAGRSREMTCVQTAPGGRTAAPGTAHTPCRAGSHAQARPAMDRTLRAPGQDGSGQPAGAGPLLRGR